MSFKAFNVGTGWISLGCSTSVFGIGLDNKTVKIAVVVNEDPEEIQEEIDELSTYCNKNISEIKSAHASEKLLYLRSVLYNDGKNGNNDLWNKFVKETTKEERKNWKRDITYNIRDASSEKQTVINALEAQIQLDDGNITQEELEEKLEEGQDTQEEYYSELVELKSDVTGSRASTTFDDILDNIDGYDKPEDLNSGTSNKIEKATSKVLTAITNIGIIVSILMIAILGVKYMLGSLEEKAEYKKDMVPYLIGAVLLFGILTFIKIFMQIGEEISNL